MSHVGGVGRGWWVTMRWLIMRPWTWPFAALILIDAIINNFIDYHLGIRLPRITQMIP